LHAPLGKKLHILVFWQNLVRFGRARRELALELTAQGAGEDASKTKGAAVIMTAISLGRYERENIDERGFDEWVGLSWPAGRIWCGVWLAG